MMEGDPRRKGPRSPSAESDDSSHRRRSRKYDRDRSPSPRRSRYRRSRSRERRSGSRERRRNKDATVVRGGQDWNKQAAQNQGNPTTTGANYVPPIHNQYQQPPPPPPNTSQPPPTLLPNYNQGYNNYNYNYNQGYDYAYQQQQQPAGYRSDYPPQNWLGNSQVSYNSQQPPPAVMPAAEVAARASAVEPTPPVVPPPASRSDDVKKEAIAAEAKQQKATLTKQRDEYVKKSTTLQRELEILREQCDEIAKESGRENSRIVKENQKLQVEIQTKMKSIHNVIDMLTGIIGDKATVDDLKVKFKNDLPKKRSRSPKDEVKKQSDIKTPEKLTQVIINNDKDDKIEREMKKQKLTDDDAKPIYNFVHYDPEMHWCKICDIFPKTAKEYLNHLHSNEHKETCLEKKIVDMPWHPRNGGGTEKEVPFYPGLPTKRTPIKGLQFFSAATAWYCKLCDSWIGDLHCASLHLKSKRHSTNFLRFVDQNPHWETDWMADREKAFSDERQKQMQLELQKQKDDEAQQQQQHHHQQQKDAPPVGQSSTSTSSKPKKSKKSKKNKKKSKKRKNKNDNSDSTSGTENTDTDSDQDMSKSIRVAMRNKMKASTQAILNEEIDYHGIKLKGHWNQKSDESKKENDDRHMINSLRDKIKSRNDNNDENNLKSHDRRNDNQPTDENDKKYQNNTDQGLEAWGPKEPPKTFWIKKDDDKTINKNQDIPKSDEIPKPHMGFWTKQQVNISSKMQDNNKDEERERYKDDRKYDRRDDNKYHRYDNYDRRRRDRDRDRDYYDERRKDRRNDDSPPSSSRRERNYRDNSSPKRSYDKYKDSRRDDESNDESKFEKKTNESASKQKKISIHNKKSSTGSSSTTTIASTTTTTPSTPTTGSNKSGKLPFIGRLPLFKKKNDDIKTMEKDITPLPYVQSKFEDTPKVPSEIINPPGIVHITKLATPVTLNNSITPSSTTTTPTSIATTKTQQPVMKILVAPPPPIINSPIKQQQPALSPQQVVDMEIENETEDTIIEESIINNNDDDNNSKKTSDIISSSVYDKINSQNNDTFTPTPFIHPPPFVQNPVHYPVSLTTPTIPPPPPTTAFNHPPPSVNYLPQQIDGDLNETGKTNPSDPSQPLPEDLQEALNIIFPKDNETSEEDKIVDNSTIGKQDNNGDNDVMYASMYSGMLGCVGYGPEYMDQPPPEITDDADGDNDEQPETDDLRMLGIDEGDTIL